MSSLSDADPVAEVIWHFLNTPEVEDLLGGADRVSGEMEGPFPHLTVTPGSTGDLTTLRGRVVHEVTVQLYGPMDHSIGAAELWRRLVRILEIGTRMPDRDHPAGRPVVARVVVQGGVTRQPLSSGQMRLNATLNVTLGLPQ